MFIRLVTYKNVSTALDVTLLVLLRVLVSLRTIILNNQHETSNQIFSN